MTFKSSTGKKYGDQKTYAHRLNIFGLLIETCEKRFSKYAKRSSGRIIWNLFFGIRIIILGTCYQYDRNYFTDRDEQFQTTEQPPVFDFKDDNRTYLTFGDEVILYYQFRRNNHSMRGAPSLFQSRKRLVIKGVEILI